jgi:hypothetical protein
MPNNSILLALKISVRGLNRHSTFNAQWSVRPSNASTETKNILDTQKFKLFD